MSDYNNPFETKPIERVKNDIHEVNRNLNKIKTDLISMRADVSLIKDFIKEREKRINEENKNISTGWFW
jgi:peptidoglycan hydrolase CwlO-like protein